MSIECQALGGNLFLLSEGAHKPILYAPLQGAVLEVNGSYGAHLQRALGGDEEALGELGLTLAALERFTETPPGARRRFDLRWRSFEPTSVTVFLTHRCTLRCAYCYCRGGEGADMPWPVFERAVRFTLDNALRRKRDLCVGFHGGDVGACWPFFTECVTFIEQLCLEAGVKAVLSLGTNGFYTQEQAIYLSQHITNATLSLDGIPEFHDAFRSTASGGPSLARILDSVKVFEANEMDYSVRMTVTRASLASLSESVEYICRHSRARMIGAEPLCSRGRALSSKLEPPRPEEFVRAFHAAQRVARRFNRELRYSGARFPGVFGSFCSYPSPTFGVTPEGNLTCCYEVLRADDPLSDSFFYGHIPADGSTVIVDEDRVRAIREWARQRREACTHCFCVFACAGDCAAKVMSEVLPEKELSERCRITRALIYERLRSVLAGELDLQRLPHSPGQGRESGFSRCGGDDE
jgi:uncharacterized protein